MNKIIVHHRSSHHAVNSGYGRLIDYTDGQVIFGQIKFPYRLAKFLAKRHSQNAGIYNSDSVLKTIELYRLLKKNKDEKNIVHFLNGERDVRHLGFLKRRFPNTVFCATFHKPPDVLKSTITDNSALKQLDAAIAVGANQVDFLKVWLDLKDVVYIPHGVDTEFFVPDTTSKKINTLLFVGQHLRDFDTFNNTIPKLASAINDLCVNVIIHPSYVSKIASHQNIELFTKVDDETLLRFYQEATVLYLPMLDGTACNSLLEAMSCGLPIITSKVGGNMTYLKGSANILIENGNEDSIIHETIDLMQDKERLEELGRLSRERSLDLDWVKVLQEIDVFYNNIEK